MFAKDSYVLKVVFVRMLQVLKVGDMLLNR